MIDIERLRDDLINYFGTAIFYNPAALMDLEEVKKADEEKLIDIAIKNSFDLNKYRIRIR